MYYEIRSARLNKTVSVLVGAGSHEASVFVRNEEVAYSSSMTADMRTQAKLNYIICRPVDGLPVGVSVAETIARRPEEVKPPKKAEVVQPAPPVEEPVEDSVEDDSTACYSEEELRSMKKPELLELIAAHPELGVESDQNKKELLEDLLVYDIPKG